MFRIEKDSIGEKKLPSGALYGIHALRARENFPHSSPFSPEWYKSTAITKLACYLTYKRFIEAATDKIGRKLPVRVIDSSVIEALIAAATELADGKHFDSFIIPAVQGGAGTSINMNINEIIANLALLKLGHKCGDYSFIDPVEDANIYQSTNDVIPTALTIAIMKMLAELEDAINNLREAVESKEKNSRDILRPGYTQMQEAVPSSYGILFSTYNDALSRDWWRVSKCSERIKQVNIGGGATGSGTAIPLYFIREVIVTLRELTGLPLAQSENLPDATANLDKWVEMHATIKAHAVNLEKMASDLRLLASDLGGRNITLPRRQVGSSIMPGKINPVIPEFVISAAHKVYSNDALISSLCSQGNLELNPYLPLVGTALIESVSLLTACNRTMSANLFEGLSVNEAAGYNTLLRSPSLTTALNPHIGYNRAAELAGLMKEQDIDIFEANRKLRVIDEEKLRRLLEPGKLLKLGFSLDDIISIQE
ncbi:MAG: lyase family protein [Bacteroidales bacterium]|jgi:aspartate ammonia-lyase|nr:lyase family protein [Bacteroidales bacterium]MCU0408593.1 lyase family protein [Bacteroidales bacterium]